MYYANIFPKVTKSELACNAVTLKYFNPLQKYTVILVATEIKWALREYIENKDTYFESKYTYGKHSDININ
jgi:hypothetical protein